MLGIPVEPFDRLDRLDIAIDGADQVASDRWAVKGGHGAHLREKIVAAAADRFVIIASENKLVETVHAPVPLELVGFGLQATLRAIRHASLRVGAPSTPDGGALADFHGPIRDPAALAAWFDQIPGVAGHGLFAPALIDDVIVGRGERQPARQSRVDAVHRRKLKGNRRGPRHSIRIVDQFTTRSDRLGFGLSLPLRSTKATALSIP
jgi:ribose 5-phosphate isomerase A